jgi:N-sulfoglucosamine sulfohydrolase
MGLSTCLLCQRGLLLVVAILLLGVEAFGTSRNVVLYVTDDQGQIAGCYGNPVIKTPHLDALAADGTRFENAYCSTASCSPSRSVILTGLHNHANGHYGLEHAYHHFRSFANVKSLPVMLSAAGYRTARIGKLHVGPERVYRFDEKLPGDARSPVEMADNCRALIESHSERPFFLYFCPSDPHRGGAANDLPHQPDRFGNKPRGESYPGVEPVHYDPAKVIVPAFLPDMPTSRAELAQYYESISRSDAGLGRLVEILKKAGKYEETLIIYISDNGYPFPGAKTTVYEPGIHLPCVVRSPDVKNRRVVSRAMVSWVDIAPTILDFAGAQPPRDVKLHGRSFLSVLDQQNPSGWDEIYASHTFHEVTMYYPMRAVRSGSYKLIWNIAHPLPFPFASDLWNSATWQDAFEQGEDFIYGKRTIRTLTHRPKLELYDLAHDADETNNLADNPKYEGVLDELKLKLKDFQRRTGDPWELKWERE